MTKREIDKSDVSWLTMLRMELSMVTPDLYIEPQSESLSEDDIDKDEAVVGVAPEEAKKLWTLFCRKEEEASRMVLDAKYIRNDVSRQEEMFMRAAEVRVKAETCKDLMFLTLRDAFHIWAPHLGVGIRSGWRVVTFRSETNFLKSLMKGLL